jgi:cyclic dehypoxanthinyl futalosine synthase
MTTTTPIAAAPRPSPARLSTGDLRAMYLDESIHALGRCAFDVTQRMHPEDYRTYVVDRNINYANWCTAKCIFCNFKADVPGQNSGRRDLPAGYTLGYDEIGRKIEELVAIGGTQILMQGGLVPGGGEVGLPFEWYLDLMRFIRRGFPRIHIHAFSPPEIFAFAQVFGMSIHDVLARLVEAGLDSVPGGGGEILSDRVRGKIGIGKTMTAEWLEVMRQCHILGMRTSCTMMFGHIETLGERLEHLRLLRDLQDESLARGNGGGFGAFICWTFQPDNTPLGRMRQLPETPKRQDAETPVLGSVETSKRRNVEMQDVSEPARVEPENRGDCSHSPGRHAPALNATRSRPLNDGRHLLLADAHEYLTMLALSRVYLDNISNIQSSWVTMGPKVGQLALFYGANDMGSVMMEENVVSAAGTTYRLDEAMIRRLIEDAGWRAQKRDYHYRPVD